MSYATTRHQTVLVDSILVRHGPFLTAVTMMVYHFDWVMELAPHVSSPFTESSTELHVYLCLCMQVMQHLDVTLQLDVGVPLSQLAVVMTAV